MPRRKPYFINPPRRKKKRRAVKRKRAVASKRKVKRAADGTFMKSVRHKSGHKVKHSAWRSSGYRRNSMARRKRRNLPGRSASGRFLKRRSNQSSYLPNRKRRRYRRNPGGGMFGGFVNDAIKVAQGGGGVLAGKVVARQGVAMLKIDPSSPIGIGAQLALAVGGGFALRRFLKMSGPFADGVVYGIAAGAVEQAIRRFAPDMATTLLGEDFGQDYELAAYATGAPALPPGRTSDMLMGAYATGTY